MAENAVQMVQRDALSARRQERRGYQSRAGRAGDGVHARSRKRVRDRQRRQRFHSAGKQAEGVRKDRLCGRRQGDSPARSCSRTATSSSATNRCWTIRNRSRSRSSRRNFASSESTGPRQSRPEEAGADATNAGRGSGPRRSTSRRRCRWWSALSRCWSVAQCSRSLGC